MEPGAQAETNEQGHFCPECGAEENGYFCRNCGALLRGEDLVLCPRCHQIVPSGEFCNQCGQTLSGIALNLRQLALAGDDFWVAAIASAPSSMAANDVESNLLAPDESVVLADAELPEWLQELPADSAPAEVQAHVYPSLKPIEETKRSAPRGRFVTLAFLLLGLLLLSLLFAVGMVLLRGG